MSTLSTRLTVVIGATALLLAVPTGAGAAPRPAPEAPVVRVLDGPVEAPDPNLAAVTGAVHYGASTTSTGSRDGDPRHGTVQVSVAVQRDGNTGAWRVRARVAKVARAVRVQIDRVEISSAHWVPAFRAGSTGSISSGTGVAVVRLSPLVGATSKPDGSTSPRPTVTATVSYAVLWSDGSVMHNVARATYSSPTTVSSRNDFGITTNTDGHGSQILNHYGDPAKGSIKIDAGMRLYRVNNLITRVQPYATISKRNTRVVSVQIDAIEARRTDAKGVTAPGYPFSVTPRSSGAGVTASSETPIARISPLKFEARTRTEVKVYYSVRWSDRTLTTGVWTGPSTQSNPVFPSSEVA